MAAKTAPSLDDKLIQARLEAQELNRRLHKAEADLEAAVSEKRYADAEELKKAADEIREPLLIAEAQVTALEAGVQAFREHQEAEERALRERQAREKATVDYQAAVEAEQVAIEQMQSHLAEVEPAFQALRRALSGAMEAEGRAHYARVSKHAAGIAAGTLHPDHPRPTPVNSVAARIQTNHLLSLIWRTERLL
ncbi:hypothetical protein ACFOSC_26575 [Streptantibioticus rubrisoli]|uniref:Uncharacterized protein n=1 Tax=Streptantibioticus rubrisoli TaxID=1387313 RepID=A0ABT1PHZ3_9ACTN|nr:hypothetical protein [Streptantibioticus rubrisoli]MCQ4043858.1 hypothetical protein [Streptantibioticus rubrisoli]